MAEEAKKYTPEEEQRIHQLKEVIDSSKSTSFEQQIAEAELNDIHITKGTV